MPREKIKIEARKEICRDNYNGAIDFRGNRFQYSLSFGFSMAHLDTFAKRLDSLMEEINLKVRDSNGKEISLDDERGDFFRKIIVVAAIDIYNSPQTRDHEDDGPIAHGAHRKGFGFSEDNFYDKMEVIENFEYFLEFKGN